MSLPPGPSAPPIVQLIRWVTTPTSFMEQCAARFGDAFVVRTPTFRPMVFLSSPEAIRRVFGSDADEAHAGELNAVLTPILGHHSVLVLDGKAHLRQRRLLSPPLRADRMQVYADTMRAITDEVIDAWPMHRPFELLPSMQRITLETIMRVVMGLTPGPSFDSFAPLLDRASRESSSHLLYFPWLQVDLGRFSPWGRIMKTMRELDRRLYGEIRARREAPDGTTRPDVLSLLLTARHEDGTPTTDVEIRDELVTQLMAGYENTLSSLVFAVHTILSTPAVYARIVAELREVVGGGPLVAAHIPRLEYLDAAVKEVLRLRPVLPVVGRVLKKPMTLGAHALPAGVIATPCPYLAHRRPEAYPDPEVFRPERFYKTKPDPTTWLPFGGGTRRCIGMALALFQIRLVLAELFLRADLRLQQDRGLGWTLRGVTFVPSNGCPVVLDARRPARQEASG